WVPGVYTSEEDMRFHIDWFEGPVWRPLGSLMVAEDAWYSFFGDGCQELGCQRIQNGDTPAMIRSDECRARERASLLGLKSRVAAEKTRFPLNPE
ncbi:hypothetical protein PIB30_106133, partial [Stylosanthes scabra]|nr:hypothetical protein [Stylosanthes scabra]